MSSFDGWLSERGIRLHEVVSRGRRMFRPTQLLQVGCCEAKKEELPWQVGCMCHSGVYVPRICISGWQVRNWPQLSHQSFDSKASPSHLRSLSKEKRQLISARLVMTYSIETQVQRIKNRIIIWGLIKYFFLIHVGIMRLFVSKS